ncbi:hypothetical protein M5K25_018325 [Dendrobium thyrsiflorum]|uniref:DUF4283 domain-containing protein n=1 Tax=Dendrobium thyrsiflorum TaxID=117978 RepID=A0ABD0UHM4_DENTH
MFDDSVVSQLAAPFALTLVGKFMLRRPNLDVIRKFFPNLKLSGSFHIGLLDPRHISIHLTNDLDYSRIFSRRAYYVQGCQMRLLKWSPDFDVNKESPIAPVWISFPNLRLHFFNSQILFGLASIFGKPLQTDQATASISRPSVARVLVELDISKKHPDEIWLGSELNGYFQKVDFENLPIFCSHCKMHGHGLKECFRLYPHLRKEKESSKQVQGIDPPDLGTSLPPIGGDSIPLISPPDEPKSDQGVVHVQGRNTNCTLPLPIIDKNIDEQLLAIFSSHNVVSPLFISSDEATKNFSHMDGLPSNFIGQNNVLSQTVVNV